MSRGSTSVVIDRGIFKGGENEKIHKTHMRKYVVGLHTGKYSSQINYHQRQIESHQKKVVYHQQKVNYHQKKYNDYTMKQTKEMTKK